MDIFDACSSDYGYRELETMANGKCMQKLYSKLRENLKSFYTESKYALYGFEDINNKKHCWLAGKIDFKPYQLDWEEALTTLQAVYADYPLLFFSDLYKTGGDPERGFISPVIDSECARGDFRRFYAEKIEEEIKKTVSSVAITSTTCREAAKKIYDYMSSGSRYDYNKGNSKFTGYVDIPSHSILNFVKNRSAVCQGFARTYQAFMNAISIPTICVHVVSSAGAHSCNLIYLTDEKKWIMVDVTLGVTNHNNRGFSINPQKLVELNYKRPNKKDLSLEYDRYCPKFDLIWEKFFNSKDVIH